MCGSRPCAECAARRRAFGDDPGGCGDPAWFTLPGGQTVAKPCGSGIMASVVCSQTDCDAWVAHIGRLVSALDKTRGRLVTLSQQTGDASNAAPLVGELGKWVLRVSDLGSCSYFPTAAATQAPNQWTYRAAQLVSDGACLLERMDNEVSRLGGQAPVRPQPPTPPPSPGWWPWGPTPPGQPGGDFGWVFLIGAVLLGLYAWEQYGDRVR